MPVKSELQSQTRSSAIPVEIGNKRAVADAKEMVIGKLDTLAGGPPGGPCRPPVPGHCTQRCRIEVARERK